VSSAFAKPSAGQAVFSLCVVLAGIALMPLGLRAVNGLLPASADRPSFVPSIETPRPRFAFDEPRAQQMRESRAEFAVIGDSTAGGRILPGHLSRQVNRGVAGLFHPGSPVPYWFLMFKNFIVENNVPSVRGVLIFFRDDQLTTQVEANSRFLDNVARDYEPELDRVWSAYRLGRFSEVHRVARMAYHFDRTRLWLEPTLVRGPAAAVAGEPAALVERMNTELFALDRLRHFDAADLAVSDESFLDFDANVDRSLLPEFIAMAERAHIRLGFIRVQRRPLPNGPPPQSPALVQYLEKLEAYFEERGIYYGDDYGDPEISLSTYSDGDHLTPEARTPYTERFARKHASFFQ
jgi:hypothetical protein